MEAALPSLEAIAKRTIRESVSMDTVCAALMVVQMLEPAADDLTDILISFLIKHLDTVLTERLQGFVELPLSTIVALLKSPMLVRVTWLTLLTFTCM